jgi:ferredoxin
MPAQVVVVKRSRRRAFAILRSVPAWLRALLSTVRGVGRRHAPLDLEAFEAFRDSKILAPERQSGIQSPRLVDGADLAGCVSCTRCIEICPSGALALGVGDGAMPKSAAVAPSALSASASVSASAIRFDLDPGRCIGCGECEQVCPSNLFEMSVDDSRVGEGPTPDSRSLLIDRAMAMGARADVH